MKKYKNFLIVLLISGICGGVLGVISHSISTIDLSLGGNFVDYINKILFGISVIIFIYLIINIIYIRGIYKKVDKDEIPKKIDNKVTNLIHYSSVLLIIGLIWEAVLINEIFKNDLGYLIILPTITILIATFLQLITMKYYNYMYPDKKYNLFQEKADKVYFDKLDEREKWITYTCAFTTFKKMTYTYIVFLVLSMIASIFITVPLILPIAIGVLWIIQISLYSIESKKFD